MCLEYGVREGLRFSVAFPPPLSNADSKWSSRQRMPPFCWRRHTSGPLGEGQLILVKKAETRPIDFFFLDTCKFWKVGG